MLIQENVKMAIGSIRSNKMRSLLTMLGIIIGIASVITIVAAGDGAQAFMRKQFEAVGTTTVQIVVNKDNALDSERITDQDIVALRGMSDIVKAASPQIQAFGQSSFREKTIPTMIIGGTEGMESLGQAEIIVGRFFSESDNLSARNVCIIDTTMADKFFGTTDIIGMEIEVATTKSRKTLQIVGVCKSLYGDVYIEGMPGTMFMPLPVALALTNKDPVYTDVFLQAYTKEQTEILADAAVNMLEARHGSRGRDVYYSQNMNTQVDMINNLMGLVQSFVAAVAGISLVVGGIGVMNIMLVAVTERTREIGIRKALGAKTDAILFQFLTESSIITSIGGVIGLVLGIIGAYVFCTVAGITPVFSPSTIIGTLIFSAFVGLFFGIYPARKAANLNPIEALRHE